MKLLILSMLMSFSAIAAPTADVQCSVNQPIVFETNWNNRVMFRQADVNIWNLNKSGEVSSIELIERFGAGFEVFYRVWNQGARCSLDNVCVSTDLSSFRGLTFSLPKEVFTNNFHNFSMRLRVNSSNRSVFANCRSNLR